MTEKNPQAGLVGVECASGSQHSVSLGHLDTVHTHTGTHTHTHTYVMKTINKAVRPVLVSG